MLRLGTNHCGGRRQDSRGNRSTWTDLGIAKTHFPGALLQLYASNSDSFASLQRSSSCYKLLSIERKKLSGSSNRKRFTGRPPRCVRSCLCQVSVNRCQDACRVSLPTYLPTIVVCRMHGEESVKKRERQKDLRTRSDAFYCDKCHSTVAAWKTISVLHYSYVHVTVASKPNPHPRRSPGFVAQGGFPELDSAHS